MRFIEIEAAQEIFDALLVEIEQGATVMVTRGGVTVAQLIPARDEANEGEAPPPKT